MDACTLYGPLVAVVVGVLKRTPWVGALVARNAKLIASVGSALTVLVTRGLIPATSAEWAQFAACVASVFAGAVATHEVALQAAERRLNG